MESKNLSNITYQFYKSEQHKVKNHRSTQLTLQIETLQLSWRVKATI